MEALLLFVSTKVASFESFLVILALIVFDLFRRRKYRFMSFVILGTALLLLVIWALKLVFAVPRPDDMRIVIDGFAFPSGHAAGITFLALVFWRYVKQIHKYSGYLVALPLLIVVSLVGYSRLYLGVHTFSQVVWGAAIAAAIFFALHVLFRQFLLAE